MRTPVGSGAGHDPPATPFVLVSEMAVALTVPLMVAFPVQTVLSAATPLNDNWPLIEEPLNVPDMVPDQSTASPFHVALIVDPFCVTATLIPSEPLFDDANVPRHAPEMSVRVPTVEDVGPAGEEHADVTVTARTISRYRMWQPDHKFRASKDRSGNPRHSQTIPTADSGWHR